MNSVVERGILRQLTTQAVQPYKESIRKQREHRVDADSNIEWAGSEERIGDCIVCKCVSHV